MKKINKNWHEILLALIISIYIIWFSYFSVLRHNSGYTAFYDLGIMDQVVYNSSQGRFLELTSLTGTENINRLGIHSDILLLFLSPFYWIYKGPETLLVIQSIVLGLGGLGIYLLSKKVLKNKNISLVFAFSYLMYVPMQRANIFDFHAVTLATSLLIFMFYFDYLEKYWLGFLFLILSIFSKEQVAFTTFFYGAYLFYRNFKEKKDLKYPIFISLFSLVWVFSSFKFIIPFFAKDGVHFAMSRFDQYGFSPKGIIIGILSKPDMIIGQLTSYDGLRYFWFLFAPLLFIPFLSPFIAFLPIADFGINLLSNDPNMRNIIFHYTSVINPFVFIGGIFGLKTIISKYKKFPINFLCGVLVVVTIIFSVVKSPLPYSFEKEIHPFLYPALNIKTINSWKEKLNNENIVVSATPRVAPHLTQRKKFFIFDKRYFYSDYIVIQIGEVNSMIYPYTEETLATYNLLRNDKNFEKIYTDGALEVYKKLRN